VSRVADPAPVLVFDSARSWEAWLAKHHARSPGAWLRIYKKGSGKDSVNYTEALDAAICYGWIDSRKRPGDALSWLQKFSPRRPRSVWSRINTQKAERLIETGRMKPAGLAEVEAAKADGRWQRAYDSPRGATMPADFLKELAKNKAAQSFFEGLSKANAYAIAYRLQTARRPETRQKRMAFILAMLARRQKFH
jgi:uncharacterized protein YdeI (YjbR/CyaY-like superfamily)